MSQRDKSFLVLFFKKEPLPCLPFHYPGREIALIRIVTQGAAGCGRTTEGCMYFKTRLVALILLLLLATATMAGARTTTALFPGSVARAGT
jgi:hypothetical protein